MKKITLLLTLVLFKFCSAIGQDYFYLNTYVGGGNAVSNVFSIQSKSKSDVGYFYEAGAGIAVPFWKKIYFAADASISKRATTFAIEAEFGDSLTIDYTINNTQIKFPVYFLWKQKIRHATFQFGIGPVFAMNVSGVGKIRTFDNGILKESETVNLGVGNGENSYFKSSDYGLGMQASYVFKNSLYFGLALNVGIKNQLQQNNNASMRYVDFGLRIGYKFRLAPYN